MRRSLPERRQARFRAFGAISAVYILGLLAASSCSDDSSGGKFVAACEQDESRACEGDNGCRGEQHCLDDGSGFGSCVCETDAGQPPAEDAGADAASDAGPSEPDAEACELQCDPSVPALCEAGHHTICFSLEPDCATLSERDCVSGFCADGARCGSCDHQCAAVDEMGCSKGALRTCTTDERGCRVWGGVDSACGSGFCQDESSCGTCIHECPTDGASECSNGELRTCVTDAFGCRAWWFWSSCALETCSDANICLPGYSMRQRGTPLDDEGLALTIDREGGTVLAGSYHDYELVEGYNQEFDAHLHVTGVDGFLDVFETWGSLEVDKALGVAVGKDNEYYVVGFTEGVLDINPAQGGQDAFLTKWGRSGVDKTPTALFTRQWGSSADDVARSVAVDRDDRTYVLGTTGGTLGAASLGGTDVFTALWDSAGNGLGTAQWGTDADDVGASVIANLEDRVFAVGHTAGTFDGRASAGGADGFAVELDRDGAVLWSAQWGTSGQEEVVQAAFDTDGGLLVVGTTSGTFPTATNLGGKDVFLSKLSLDGTVLWTKQWGTAADDVASSVAVGRTGKIYVGMTVEDADANCELGQVILSEWSGTPAEVQKFDTCERDVAGGVAVNPNDIVFITGYTWGSFVDSESRGGSDIFFMVAQPAN